jgi:rare lipoprotein A
VTGALSVSRPATATDLESLRQRAQAAADQVSALEHRLSGLEIKKQQLERGIANASIELGAVDLRRQEADRRYEAAKKAYVKRAVQAYMNGPTSDLAVILSADSLESMYSAMEALGHQADADTRSLKDLISARTSAEAAQAQIDRRKASLLAARAQIEDVGRQISGTLLERRATVADLGRQISSLEAQIRAAAAAQAAAAGYQGGAGGQPSQSLLSLLQPAGPTNGIPPGFTRTGVTFEGTASWYGPGFEGQTTASGDVFDSNLFTAASKELPLHSWLYVEHDGRGIVVLINDRGPYVGDRILDLSHAAAQAIGISGLGWVKAEVLVKNPS